MRRQIPNALTVGRLILSVIFFLMLALYDYDPDRISWFLFTAGWVYGVAAATDWVDGYLARKWQVVSVFGRIVDPFVDKILILGTFAFLAGRNFSTFEDGQIVPLTGISPVVVVLLIARELLVTTLRGVFEGGGRDFSADWSGKAKMIVQSVAVPVVLVYVIFLPVLGNWEFPLRIVRDVFVWGTVLVTLGSGLTYVRKAIAYAKEDARA